MIERIEYLEILEKWKDDKVIKVVTGIRRSGKSTLLMQFQERLKKSGVEDSQIISINFEDLEYEDLQDYKKLYSYLKETIDVKRKNYILLDEIQRVDSFEKVVDSLYVKENIDIYITGSNSYMLSSDLATLLSGRYVEIKMLPLSFKEYNSVSEKGIEATFNDYMKYGGLPYIATMNKDSEKIEMYLEGIYNTVIVKDIEDRQNRRNSDIRKITDIALLKSIARSEERRVGKECRSRWSPYH